MKQAHRLTRDATVEQAYRALRLINPSPYMFYFDFRDFNVVGASVADAVATGTILNDD